MVGAEQERTEVISASQLAFVILLLVYLFQSAILVRIMWQHDLVYGIGSTVVQLFVLVGILRSQPTQVAGIAGGHAWLIYSWKLSLELCLFMSIIVPNHFSATEALAKSKQQSLWFFTLNPTADVVRNMIEYAEDWIKLDNFPADINELARQGAIYAQIWEWCCAASLGAVIYALISLRASYPLYGGVNQFTTESVFHTDAIIHVFFDILDLVVATYQNVSMTAYPTISHDHKWLSTIASGSIVLAFFLHAYSFPSIKAIESVAINSRNTLPRWKSCTNSKKKTKTTSKARQKFDHGSLSNEAEGDIYTARKYAALVGIFFVDIPQLAFRSLHYYLITRSFEWPCWFIIKNIVCIPLQLRRTIACFAAGRIPRSSTLGAIEEALERNSAVEEMDVAIVEDCPMLQPVFDRLINPALCVEEGPIQGALIPWLCVRVLEPEMEPVAILPGIELCYLTCVIGERDSIWILEDDGNIFPCNPEAIAACDSRTSSHSGWAMTKGNCGEILEDVKNTHLTSPKRILDSLMGSIPDPATESLLPGSPPSTRILARRCFKMIKTDDKNALAQLLDHELLLEYRHLLRIMIPVVALWVSQIAIVLLHTLHRRTVDTKLDSSLWLYNYNMITDPEYRGGKVPIDVMWAWIICGVNVVIIPIGWAGLCSTWDLLGQSLYVPLRLLAFQTVVLTFREFGILDDLLMLRERILGSFLTRYSLLLLAIPPLVDFLRGLYPLISIVLGRSFISYYNSGIGGQYSRQSLTLANSSYQPKFIHDGDKETKDTTLADEEGLLSAASLVAFLACQNQTAPPCAHQLLIGDNVVKGARLHQCLTTARLQRIQLEFVLIVWLFIVLIGFPVSYAYGADEIALRDAFTRTPMPISNIRRFFFCYLIFSAALFARILYVARSRKYTGVSLTIKLKQAMYMRIFSKLVGLSEANSCDGRSQHAATEVIRSAVDWCARNLFMLCLQPVKPLLGLPVERSKFCRRR